MDKKTNGEKMKAALKYGFSVLLITIPLTFLIAHNDADAALPQTYQEFKTRYQQEGTTPEMQKADGAYQDRPDRRTIRRSS